MSTLESLIEAVDLHGNAKDWRGAIALAGGLLEKTGAITSEYTEDMIRSVEENGPYIVVAPGFAFAHARPSPAVVRTAVSWVRLEHPVAFGHPDNDPVDLVVALAARDDSAHRQAMKELAGVLGKKRAELDAVEDLAQLRAVVGGPVTGPKSQAPGNKHKTSPDSVPSKGKILTVCGNGLGTSLFLKNTLDQVLDAWGWGPYLTVEATDTISAKGRASEADFLLTSGEIAAALGDVGVPVHVISNFTSESEIDAALRELYDV